jgi:ribosomal protection tetracycline resistance protein
MLTLNLGILAHVDAGKTSLTERLLYTAGAIDKIGSVDGGNTQTDTLDLERQRGITIKAAVVSFVIDDFTVNLIDTPGHPDFIAEVERALNVLDGAVLVISAVEGVQAQTRLLMQALRRLRIPTLFFVNKIDRRGARVDEVLQQISERLAPDVIAMGAVDNSGTKLATFAPYGAEDEGFRDRLIEVLAEHDDQILSNYVEKETAVSYEELQGGLVKQVGRALVHPVFFGSAITGAGMDALVAGISDLLPPAKGDADGSISGTIFKIERGHSGEKIAYVRMFSGTIRARERVVVGGGREAKVSGIRVFDRGSISPSASISAGQIGKLWGLGDIKIGDTIGLQRETTSSLHFAPPTLETVIAPRRLSDKGALRIALTDLAEQDPLINLRQDNIRQELFLSLYGEVQKEVIQQTLMTDFGIDVEFRETTMICVERPIGTGAALEILKKAPNPFLATIGLRIDPAPINSGLKFNLEIEYGSVPPAFLEAVEETAMETLRQGLHGWQVTDCTVAMTHAGYASPQSTAADFRSLTPLVVMEALKMAGTSVCEPIHRFQLDLPADALGPVMPLLARLGAIPRPPVMRGSSCLLEGDIPAARVHEVHLLLPGLTRGEGVLEAAFESYRPVQGAIPERARTDRNPLNRKQYLLRLSGRVLSPSPTASNL